MDIVCPSCSAEGRLYDYMRGQEVRCTRCQHSWVPSATPRPFEPSTPYGAPSYDRWLSGWSLTAGIWLLVSFLLPIAIEMGRSRYGGSRMTTIWFWDMLDEARGNGAFGVLLPALVGIAALIVGGTMRGRARAVTIFSLGAGTLVLGILLAADSGGVRMRGVGRMFRSDQMFLVLLLLLASSSVAVGNRVRKHHPGSLVPRLLAGIGGCVVVLIYLLPIERTSMIEGFFQERAWRNAWPILLMLLLLLTYGVLAIFHFGRVRTREGLCMAVSIFGRIVVIGAPLAFLAMALNASDGPRFGPLVLAALKVTLVVYGVLALLGTGLTAWIADVLKSGSPAPAMAEAPVPAAPLGDLKTRLERLKAALDEGLLTEEEYEAKRQQIVDTAEF